MPESSDSLQTGGYSPSFIAGDDQAEFETCVAQFEAAWHRQACPNISEFLPGGIGLRQRVLDELLRIDVEFRHRLQNRTTASQPTDVTPLQSASQSKSHDASHLEQIEMFTVYSTPKDHARGGLGDVLISQEHCLGRTVAIKQLQAKWRHSSRARRAFLREVAITSQLEHPGIVPVYCSGKTDDGRPCYSMRYIHGRTLQKAIEEFHRHPDYESTAFRSMLASFVMVCNTIAFAHNRQIIHRDLKPDNVMLGPYGETLVLDWGLAKKLAPKLEEQAGETVEREHAEFDLTDHSTFDDPHQEEADSSRGLIGDSTSGLHSTSMPGDIVGTPAYMSPEQASGSTDRVQYAADIFGLGAMLFAILYGRGPFKAQAPEMSLEHARRGQVAGNVDNRCVPKPLQLICAKAMQGNPADRYLSPLAIAEDITNWLSGQPVSVMREPWWQRTGRFIGRKKTLAWTTLAITLMLVMTVLIAFYRLSIERQKSFVSSEVAKAQRDTSKRIATVLSQAFLTNDFVPAPAIQNFSMPDTALKDVVSRLMTEGELLVAQSIDDEPALNARMLMCLGTSYRALGQFEKARELLIKSRQIRSELFGDDSLITLESTHQLARLYYMEGDYAAAEPLMRQAVASYQAVESTEPLLLADAKYSLAWLLYWQPMTGTGPTEEALRESIQLFKDVLALRETHLRHDDNTVGLACSGLAAALSCIDERADEAALYATRAVQIAHATSTPNQLNNFLADYFQAERLRKKGDYNEAAQLYKNLQEQIRQTLGTQHPIYILHLWNDAGLHNKFGRHDLAEQTVQTIRGLVRSQPAVRSSPLNVEGLFIFAEALSKQRQKLAMEVCLEALTYAHQRPGLNAKAIGKLEALKLQLTSQP